MEHLVMYMYMWKRIRSAFRAGAIGRAGTAACLAGLLALTLPLLVGRTIAQDLSSIPSSKPVTLSGAMSAQGQHLYSSNGNLTGRPDMTGYLNLAPTLTIYGVQFPFSIQLTTSESSFRQPFNEFGVSPRYKWITGHFGYRSMSHSPFTLSSVRWLGAGVDIRADWLRVSMMYGRFQKAAEEDTVRRLAALYDRRGYAVKLGLGSETNSVDISWFRGWDDKTSVARATYGLSPEPAENAVLSIGGRLSLLDGRIRCEGEIAGSAYTRDVNAPEEEGSIANIVKYFITPRTSTQAVWALRSSVSYGDRYARIAVKYERIEPDFRSMGAGYIADDREDITIAPSTTLFGILRLNGSIGFRRNNLLNDRAVTSRRLILSGGASVQAAKDLGFDLRYANYALHSTDGRTEVTDSTRMESVSQSASLGARYAMGDADARHSFTVMLTHSDYADRNPFRGASNNSNTTALTAGYGFARGEYTLNGSVTQLFSQGSTYRNSSTSAQASASRSFFDRALSLSAHASCSIVTTPQATDVRILPGLNASWRLSDTDTMSLHTQLSRNMRPGAASTEIVTSARFTKTFR